MSKHRKERHHPERRHHKHRRDHSSSSEESRKRKHKKQHHRKDTRRRSRQRENQPEIQSKRNHKEERRWRQDRSASRSKDKNKERHRADKTEPKAQRKTVDPKEKMLKRRVQLAKMRIEKSSSEEQVTPMKVEDKLPKPKIEQEPDPTPQFLQDEDYAQQEAPNKVQPSLDALDQLMMSLEKEAQEQLEVIKPISAVSVTLQDIAKLGKGKESQVLDDQQYYSQFKKLLSGSKAAQQQKQEEPKQAKALNYFERQKKLASRKQINQVDHSHIAYEPFCKRFYIESKQITQMDQKQIQKFRKENGDIKVRGKDPPKPVLSWHNCGFTQTLLTALLEKLKFSEPFPIQTQAIPVLLSGRDLIAIAETGSGKTMAYTLPLVRHVADQRPCQEGEGPIGIIMAPTRELAHQIYQAARPIVKCAGVRISTVCGGSDVQKQIIKLKRGVQILVCTPGRLIDMLTMSRGKITNLTRVTFVVIDQADRMFDLGFQPQITKIMNNVRPDRQVALFSATFPRNVQTLAKKLLSKPIEVVVGSRGRACCTIQQIIEVREESTKFLRLLELLGEWTGKGKVLIFVDKQNEADHLFRELLVHGYNSLVLHGGMDAEDRQFTIYDFRKGVRGIDILVATSVCARGIDIRQITLVVNFKCPNHMEDYIHRIGRTGRAGTQGTAVTFLTLKEEAMAPDLVKALTISGVAVPDDLRQVYNRFIEKVECGQAKIYTNRHIQGSGFKFDQEQEEKQHKRKKIIQKQISYENNELEQDSEDQDIFVKKAVEEARRGGKTDQQKLVDIMKDPESKQRLLSEAGRVASEAINQGHSTEKVLQLTTKMLKEALQSNRFKVMRNVSQGIDHVTKIVREAQKKGEQFQRCDYDFQINDYPIYARQRICASQFLTSIGLLTNTTIRMRGAFVDPAKKNRATDRPLYLHIEGDNRYQVQLAYRQLKKYVEQVAFASAHGSRINGKFALC